MESVSHSVAEIEVAVLYPKSRNQTLQAQNITFRYETGVDFVLKEASISIEPGEQVALVGPNGSGKSTLLKILAGELKPQSGIVHSNGQEVLYLPQEIDFSSTRNVRDWLYDRLGLALLDQELKRLEKAGLEDALRLKEWGEIRQRFEALDGDNFETSLMGAESQIPLIDFKTQQRVNTLSGGQMQRLKLILIALAKHNVVLMDEPTNDLDRDGIGWLEGWMANAKAGIVIVSHDRYLLNRVINRIAVVDPQTHKILKANCRYSEFTEQVNARRERVFSDYLQQREQIKELKKKITEAKSKTDRSAGKAGRTDRDKMSRDYRAERGANRAAAKVRRLEKELSRIVEIEIPPAKEYEMRFNYQYEPIQSPIALVFQNLSTKLGGKKFGPYSDEILSGDRLSITGPNGSGKTTFLRMLFREIKVEGTTSLAHDAKVFFMPQGRWLKIGQAVWKLVEEQIKVPEGEAKSRLTQFGVTEDFWGRDVASLSPGERTRLLACLINLQKPNFIVLDEPTNHLDSEAIAALEKGLSKFKGTLVLVSHDSVFLDNVGINKIWKISPDKLGIST